ncbi:MAG: hypothetical protein J0M18_09430 [Ignavibacteria bacterium]|nr:hypothetical protein [Ignavibacteria bacterium]
MIKNPSVNIKAQPNDILAAQKKPSVNKGIINCPDGETMKMKDIHNLIGWQIY